MSPGLAAAQAGHAFLASFLNAHPDDTRTYLRDGWTKIVLLAADEAELHRLHEQAKSRALACALWIEDEVFPGGPTLTALGIGPTSRSIAKEITRRLPLMK